MSFTAQTMLPTTSRVQDSKRTKLLLTPKNWKIEVGKKLNQGMFIATKERIAYDR